MQFSITGSETSFPNPIYSNDFKIALVNISIPKSYVNIKSDFVTVVYNNVRHLIAIYSGHYKTVSQVTGVISKELSKIQKEKIHFSFEPVINRILLNVEKDTVVSFGEKLKKVLGFKKDEYREGHHLSEVAYEIPQIFVQVKLDCCDENCYTFPVEISDLSIQNLNFVPINKAELTSVKMELTDQNNNAIDFLGGQPLASFEIRKVLNTLELPIIDKMNNNFAALQNYLGFNPGTSTTNSNKSKSRKKPVKKSQLKKRKHIKKPVKKKTKKTKKNLKKEKF